MNWVVQSLVRRDRMIQLDTLVLCDKHAGQLPAETVINRLDSTDPCEVCERSRLETWEDYRAYQSDLLQAVVTRGVQSVYIAGPMTGLVDYNRPAFHRMARLLRTAGRHVLSPAEHKDGMTYQWYMMEDLKWLLSSDGVIFLHGWELSRGAKLEMQVAETTGKQIFFEL